MSADPRDGRSGCGRHDVGREGPDRGRPGARRRRRPAARRPPPRPPGRRLRLPGRGPGAAARAAGLGGRVWGGDRATGVAYAGGLVAAAAGLGVALDRVTRRRPVVRAGVTAFATWTVLGGTSPCRAAVLGPGRRRRCPPPGPPPPCRRPGRRCPPSPAATRPDSASTSWPEP